MTTSLRSFSDTKVALLSAGLARGERSWGGVAHYQGFVDGRYCKVRLSVREGESLVFVNRRRPRPVDPSDVAAVLAALRA